MEPNDLEVDRLCGRAWRRWGRDYVLASYDIDFGSSLSLHD